jgi:two-component system nitrate/nitrite response regulator NarL
MPRVHKIAGQSLRRKALLVAESAATGRLLSAALARLGNQWEGVICRNGRRAMQLIREQGREYDFAVVGMILSDIKGLDVLRAWMKAAPQSPVLVVSSATEERTVLAAIRNGARGYLVEPESDRPLAESFRELLAGHYPVSPQLSHTLFRLAGAPPARVNSGGFRLTPREYETLRHLSRGLTYDAVAKAMDITLSTVQTNVRHLYRKLGAHSQMQAVNKARAHGLI